MSAHIPSRRSFFALVLLAGICEAGPVPVLNIPDLVNRADVIVVGRITYVTDAGSTTIETANGEVPARNMAGEIDVDHVLKGTTGISVARFQFALPDLPLGYRTVTPGAYRVLFLKGSTPPFRFVSPYSPSVIALPGAEISAPQVLDRVLEAVSAVLASQGSTLADKREAINALWGVTNEPARAGLRFALREHDVSLKLNAAAALLSGNDLSALPVATEALLRPDRTLPDDLLLNLRGAISRGVTAKEAIPSLVRLQSATDAATRRAAATALGRTGANESLPHLGKALDDPDFEVRLAAVRGLAEVTGQREHAVSTDAFRADDQRLVA